MAEILSVKVGDATIRLGDRVVYRQRGMSYPARAGILRALARADDKGYNATGLRATLACDDGSTLTIPADDLTPEG